MVLSSLFEIALKLGDEIKVDAKTKGDRLVSIVIDHIEKQTEKSLIIIDNLDSDDFPSLANKIINGGLLNNSKVSIIITARVQEGVLKPKIIKSSNCTFINVDCLGLKEGIRFMKAKLKSDDII